MSNSGWVQGFHDFFVQYLRENYSYRFPDVVEVSNIDQIEYVGCESCSCKYIVLMFDYRDEGDDVWWRGSIDSTFADILEAAARA